MAGLVAYVLRVNKPVRRWVRFVPISMIVVAVLAIDYGHLADQTAGLVVALIAVAVAVGFTEELMFRGLGVTVFRRGGFSEGNVALWSSVIFGAAHISNAVGQGPGAIAQALVVSTTGYFLYLTFRVGGVIFLSMLVHGLWDFSLLSGQIGPHPGVYVGNALVILTQVVLMVAVLRRRHRTEEPEQPVAAPVPVAT